MDHFYACEDSNGVRFSWNCWPSTTIDCKKLFAPLACLYAPMKVIPPLKTAKYDPLFCTCGCYLNPYCHVDLNSHSWSCPICFQRNRFPQHYSGMTATNVPMELMPDSTTIEYELPGPVSLPPAFIFVVDISLDERDLEALKTSLLQCISLIPDEAFVGFITYGQQVNVYELGFPFCPKMHVFGGNSEVSPETVQKTLGLGQATAGGKVQVKYINKFIQPFSDVVFNLTSILEDLFPDPRPTKSDQRKHRATGVAVQVAVNILEYTFARSAARILVFGGGPSTIGPGMVVGEELKEGIRSHSELNKEKAPHVYKATKFYTSLAEQASKNGHTIDIFSCSLDQTGILEMKEMPYQTGGVIVTAETFSHPQFKRSLFKLFEKDEKGGLQMGFNAKIEVKASKELGIHGAIGHLSSNFNKNGIFAEPEIGIGRTSEWKTGTIDTTTSYAFFFDVVSDQKNMSTPSTSPHYGVIQFRTRYASPSGKYILRVTTTAHNWVTAGAQPSELLGGFDQEACAAIIARLAIYKKEAEDEDIIRFLDRHLIRFVQRYGIYQRDNENSFQLPPSIGLYPNFMFHLRRCCLVNIFGNSPDETAYYRHYLQKETTSNILTMLQPSLDSYSVTSPEPAPVLLSATSLLPEVVLVLDTFFHVVVWCGSTIASWRGSKYHELPEYSNLKQLLEIPVQDAEQILSNRFPYSLFVQCDQNTSQARFLLAVVDPGQTSALGQVGESVNTEDASLQRFMDHLKKFVVKSE
eukprot:TRINITY_DN5716_c0_g1_i1.p1 TRINITY_DN5716_c0_g1~~TRINITY_DN5716_c0_g1_i1.p1  ORF type:complete len:750 (-),score=123.34 TRINITY_DN5716_c0_g1_i1:78-2327(-)